MAISPQDHNLFDGQTIYGDDFTEEQVAAWFEDEREGYADLPNECDTTGPESYGYHGLNWLNGFRHFRGAQFDHALGFGSALGGEFMPIAEQIKSLSIVEPSTKLRSATIGPLVPRYVEPTPSGELPFADASFDLVVSLGVLHHIPNVSFVVSELARCTMAGGKIFVREPITSMGDWRRPRAGLTKRERGIPQQLLIQALERSGYEVERATLCLFPTTSRIGKTLPALGPAGRPGAILDTAVSRLFARNYTYHATTPSQKLRPTSLAVVANKK